MVWWKCRPLNPRYFSRYRHNTRSTSTRGTRRGDGTPRRRSINPSYPDRSYRAFQRRIVRGVTPMISAACNHVYSWLTARAITSRTFIARSTAVSENHMVTSSVTLCITHRESGQITCYEQRTNHELTTHFHMSMLTAIPD